jgi:hypothetical protein
MLLVGFFVATGCSMPSHQTAATDPLCDSQRHTARLTNYESYPKPGSEECIENNGCTWAGQFYGLSGKKSENWVRDHNIVAVHLKDWETLGMKTLRLQQDDRTLMVKVYDACSDADCEGCCTANLGGDGYLVDIEKYTMERFGSDDGLVTFQVCQ